MRSVGATEAAEALGFGSEGDAGADVRAGKPIDDLLDVGGAGSAELSSGGEVNIAAGLRGVAAQTKAGCPKTNEVGLTVFRREFWKGI